MVHLADRLGSWIILSHISASRCQEWLCLWLHWRIPLRFVPSYCSCDFCIFAAPLLVLKSPVPSTESVCIVTGVCWFSLGGWGLQAVLITFLSANLNTHLASLSVWWFLILLSQALAQSLLLLFINAGSHTMWLRWNMMSHKQSDQSGLVSFILMAVVPRDSDPDLSVKQASRKRLQYNMLQVYSIYYVKWFPKILYKIK